MSDAAANAADRGPVFIISGPSGSGKTTLIRRVLARSTRPLRLSVSATTRPPRPGETDGVEYWFWDRPRFEAAIANGEFLEHAIVHGRDYYGTLEREVGPFRSRGVGVILDIDVQGAEQVRPKLPEAVTIFIVTSDLGAFADRLRRRGTEDEESIARRLETARRELTRAGEYQHLIRNDELETATSDLTAVIEREFSKGV